MGLNIVVLGLTVTSSWGNGHATTYRALLGALHRRGHRLLFLERERPWYAANRDMPHPPFCRVGLYESVDDLAGRFAGALRQADLTIVGSYVPDGAEVGRWVLERAPGIRAFYDIDTPITLAALRDGSCRYLTPELVAGYDLYLSFTGGPALATLEGDFGAARARPLYCAVDADAYRPGPAELRWHLGYMGTYSADRQAKLEQLLLRPARRLPDRRFAVAGSQFPEDVDWPANVERFEHLPPSRHRGFYCGQRFTLNLTRAEMARLGWSPSVRLFEAAACGTAIVSDDWPGLESFFRPGEEILVADSAEAAVEILAGLSEAERQRVGVAARQRVLRSHTAEARAARLEAYVEEAAAPAAGRSAPVSAAE